MESIEMDQLPNSLPSDAETEAGAAAATAARVLRERRWFVLERPRRDTNGGSETEVTVTSKLPSKHRKKQGDRKETEKRREGSIPWGLRQRLDELSGGCAKRGAAESEGGRRPECPG